MMKFLTIISTLFFFLYPVFICASTLPPDTKPALSKEDKMILANATGLLVITTWGIINWDYGERSASASSEGWFGQDTKEGGADKLGHMYTGYALTHSFSYLYKSWGYTQEKAPMYGAFSAFGIIGFMEVGDAFSNYGFSYEDMIMNTVGCYSGYVLYKHPNLSKKLDIRIEYTPDFSVSDMATDYENMKFLMALKLDGFSSVTHKTLKYIEFHLGYYARGYSDKTRENKRYTYIGIGFNLSRFFSKKSFTKTATFLNYYQPPYTYLEHRYTLQN